MRERPGAKWRSDAAGQCQQQLRRRDDDRSRTWHSGLAGDGAGNSGRRCTSENAHLTHSVRARLMGAPFLGLVIGNEQDDWGAEQTGLPDCRVLKSELHTMSQQPRSSQAIPRSSKLRAERLILAL